MQTESYVQAHTDTHTCKSILTHTHIHTPSHEKRGGKRERLHGQVWYRLMDGDTHTHTHTHTDTLPHMRRERERERDFMAKCVTRSWLVTHTHTHTHTLTHTRTQTHV